MLRDINHISLEFKLKAPFNKSKMQGKSGSIYLQTQFARTSRFLYFRVAFRVDLFDHNRIVVNRSKYFKLQQKIFY